MFFSTPRGGGAVFNLTNAPQISAFSATSAPTIGITVNADGTIDENDGSSWAQRNASTDWAIPNSAAPAVWVRFDWNPSSGTPSWASSVSGRTCVTPNEPDGTTWYQVTGSGVNGRTFGFRKNLPAAAGTCILIAQVAIARDSGGSNIIATASIQMESENTGV